MAENQRPILPFEAGHITPNTSRAADVRRDTDLVKLPKVTLYDIDYAVLWHINKNMALKIEHENRMIDVPAIFADGERWAQIKSRGYMRDASKKLMEQSVQTVRKRNPQAVVCVVFDASDNAEMASAEAGDGLLKVRDED